MRSTLSCVGLVLGSLLVLVSLTGCSSGNLLMSQDQEITVGQQAAAKFQKENGGLDRDATRNAITQRIAKRIIPVANASPYPTYPYQFRVLANNQVNANTFPGGIVYLWRGLFNVTGNNEEQIAWVAGHEAAHVARKHISARMERSVGSDLLIQLVLGKDNTGQIASLVAGLSLQAYGRDQELEADRVGAVFAHDAGYDPTAALAVLEKFKSLGSDPNSLELIFADHPGSTTREDDLKAFFRQQGWTGKYLNP